MALAFEPSGVDSEPFFRDNVKMQFDGAKKMTEEITHAPG